jgi:hypothetical protein
MKYLLISVVILLLTVYLLWQYGKRPARHKVHAQGDFTKFLEALLYRGYDKGFLIIEAPTKERFLQFRKYIKSKGHVGLQFDFPLAPWSTKYYERLKKLLDERGYEYEIDPTDTLDAPGSNLVTEFLFLDLKQNLESANELTRLCLLEVFKLKPEETVTLYFVGGSPLEEKIGF